MEKDQPVTTQSLKIMGVNFKIIFLVNNNELQTFTPTTINGPDFLNEMLFIQIQKLKPREKSPGKSLSE